MSGSKSTSLPDAQEQSDGRNTVLVFKEGMRNVLREALSKSIFDDLPFVFLISKTEKFN